MKFNYHPLSDDDSTFIRGQTGLIKSLIRRTAQDIIDIGLALLEVKARLPHGQFGLWLSAEFSWSDDTAGRMMNTAKHFGQIPHGADFDPSALYLLASPSTPQAARSEAIEKAMTGETISRTEAKAIVQRHQVTENETISLKPPPEKSTDPPEVFELETEHEKLDGKPKSTCPKCGFRYI